MLRLITRLSVPHNSVNLSPLSFISSSACFSVTSSLVICGPSPFSLFLVFPGEGLACSLGRRLSEGVPNHLHFHLRVFSSTPSSAVLCQRSLMSIISGQMILSIFSKTTVNESFNFSCYSHGRSSSLLAK